MVDIQGAQLRSFSAYLADRQASTTGVSKTAGLNADGSAVVAASIPYNSLADRSAVGDGVTDNTAKVAAAKTDGGYIFVPEGDYLTTLTTAQLPVRMHGFGQVEDTYGKRAPNFIYQTEAPASIGDSSFIGTAFDGDLSNVHLVLEKWIMGASTLGTPVSPAYEQNPENASIYMNTYNSGGANSDTGSNGGRTGAAMLHMKYTHNGQGDFGGIFINGTVTSSKVGATNFLASPAAVMINGGLIALSDHAFLNITELNAYDNGYDVAAMTLVSNFHRSNGTAALGEAWIFCRAQSKGSVAADVAYMATGKWKVFLDATVADLGANKTVLAMPANGRIYGGATSSGLVAWCQTPGDDWMDFDATAGWRFNHDGVVSASLGKVYLTVQAPNGILIGNTGCLNLLGANQATTGSTTPTFAANNKPGATVAGPATWMKVVMAGTTYWAPLWAN